MKKCIQCGGVGDFFSDETTCIPCARGEEKHLDSCDGDCGCDDILMDKDYAEKAEKEHDEKGWESEFRKMFLLKVTPHEENKELMAYLLQQEANHWWNEIFVDPAIDFIHSLLASAVKAERERILREIVRLTMNAWHEAQTVSLQADGSVIPEINIEKMGKILLKKISSPEVRAIISGKETV